VGDAHRPRGHALLFFRDGDDPDEVWATYLVVTPIQMDLGKYIPAAFAPQLAGQLQAAGPTAYPLPPIPEKIAQGLAWLEQLAELRGDDLLDGGVLRLTDPLSALQPVAEIGAQYAAECSTYFAAAESTPPAPEQAQTTVDVDDLLLQAAPDRDKVSRLARLVGTLRYAIEGGDQRLAEETTEEMQRVARRLPDKYRAAELIVAAAAPDTRSGRLAQLYVDRCYRLADEDYAALAELDRKIEGLKTPES
jgi:hypothetical protein